MVGDSVKKLESLQTASQPADPFERVRVTTRRGSRLQDDDSSCGFKLQQRGEKEREMERHERDGALYSAVAADRVACGLSYFIACLLGCTLSPAALKNA